MLKENYQISRLKKEEVASAVLLVRAAFEELYLIPSIYRSDGIVSYVQSELKNPLSAYDYFIIRNNTGMVGFCEFRKIENVAFLNMIATHPAMKGKGIGAQLLEYCKQYYEQSNSSSIMLDVSCSNQTVQNWYQRIGFKVISTKTLSRLSAQDIPRFGGSLLLQNYPQMKALQTAYGFCMLETSVNNEPFRFGYIKDSLFLRGEHNEQLLQVMKSLGENLKVDKLYVLAEQEVEGMAEGIDKINRMQLVLNSPR